MSNGDVLPNARARCGGGGGGARAGVCEGGVHFFSGWQCHCRAPWSGGVALPGGALPGNGTRSPSASRSGAGRRTRRTHGVPRTAGWSDLRKRCRIPPTPPPFLRLGYALPHKHNHTHTHTHTYTHTAIHTHTHSGLVGSIDVAWLVDREVGWFGGWVVGGLAGCLDG